MIRIRAFGVAAMAVAIAIGVSARPRALGKPGFTPVPCPQREWQLGDASFEALAAARAFSGRYDGGLYRIEIPKKWNGELVLFAHGYFPVQRPDGSNLRILNHPIREHLIQEGFAWAASSYRCNGYVPGQGLVDSMALVDLFKKSNRGRAPRRTYLTGGSMGGYITILGMQEFPTSFAGGLAMCPGGPEVLDLYTGIAAAAESITGIRLERDTLQQSMQKISLALGKPPELTDQGRQLARVEIEISGGLRPFAVEGLASEERFIANVTVGAAALAGVDAPQYRAVDTNRIKYPGDLNQRVRRKDADSVYRGESTPYRELAPFDGRIERPLLTMHGTGDLFVPISLEQTLKRAFVSAKTDRFLVQRIYRIAGHCGFSETEMIEAFDDLVAWVRGGAKPEGDDVNGDLSDAGRTFTKPLRENDPGGLQVK